MKGKGRKGVSSTDEQELNLIVMKRLEKSGAINYLTAGMFTKLAEHANVPENKSLIIASDAEPPNTQAELIAARLTFEFLIDHQFMKTKESLQKEVQGDSFSSKTTASLTPLQLQNNNKDLGVISQLIELHKIQNPPLKQPTVTARSVPSIIESPNNAAPTLSSSKLRKTSNSSRKHSHKLSK